MVNILVIVSIAMALIASAIAGLCYQHIKWVEKFAHDRLLDAIQSREAIHENYARRVDALTREALTHLSARSAREAAEAQAVGQRSQVEVEILQEALREEREKAKESKRSIEELPPDTITTADGRVLRLVEDPNDFL